MTTQIFVAVIKKFINRLSQETDNITTPTQFFGASFSYPRAVRVWAEKG